MCQAAQSGASAWLSWWACLSACSSLLEHKHYHHHHRGIMSRLARRSIWCSILRYTHTPQCDVPKSCVSNLLEHLTRIELLEAFKWLTPTFTLSRVLSFYQHSVSSQCAFFPSHEHVQPCLFCQQSRPTAVTQQVNRTVGKMAHAFKLWLLNKGGNIDSWQRERKKWSLQKNKNIFLTNLS